MGWGNPAVSWSEMERILAGRPARSESAPSREGAPEVDGPGTLHPADVGTVPVREDGRRARPSRDVAHPGDGGDSPAWSRTRAPYRPPSGTVAGTAPTPVPYAELHTHSNFSFLDGASQPEELVEEAARLGLEAIALTDHDGMYGVVRFAEAAQELGVRTVFGAELSLGLSAPQNGVADPEGEPPAGAGPRPGRATAGYLAAITERPAGPAARRAARCYDLERLAATLARARSWCSPAAARAPCAGRWTRRARRGRPRAATAWSSCSATDKVAVELTDHGLPARHRAQRRARRARRTGRPAHRRHQRRALRHAGRRPARRRAGGGAGPAQPRRGRGLAAGRRHRAPALRGGDGRPVRAAIPGRSRTAAVLGRRVRLRAAAARPRAAAVRRPAGGDRGELAAPAHRRRGAPRYGSRASEPAGVRGDRARAGDHRGAGLPRLLPHRRRHRGVLPPGGHPTARAAARPRTRRSASRWASPTWTP